MAEVKGVRIRTQLLEDLRKKIKYWDLKEEAVKIEKGRNNSLSCEHKE